MPVVGGIAVLPEQKVSFGFGPNTVDVMCVARGSVGRQSYSREDWNVSILRNMLGSKCSRTGGASC